MGATTFLLVLGLVALSWAKDIPKAQAIPEPRFSLLSKRGLHITIPNVEGLHLWGIHYSINNALSGEGAGEWNFDITKPSGKLWMHDNHEVTLNPGDTVNYWHLVVIDGISHQVTEQSWTVPEPQKSKPAAKKPKKIINKQADDCTDYPCVIFEDNFDTLDLRTWEHEITASGGGNWEFQYYANNRSNSYVRDGVLYIKPTLTDDKYGEGFISSGTLDLWGGSPSTLCTGNNWWGCSRGGNADNYINPIQSARLRSVHSFSFTYGRVDVEAQMPRGDWIWPAIWMLSREDFYNGWPSSGEIDLVEGRGNLELRNEDGELRGHQHAGATMHWGPFWPWNMYELTGGSREADFGDSFHLYSMEWDENGLRLLIDNDVVVNAAPGDGGFWEYGGLDQVLPADRNPWIHGTKMAPFDRDFHFILNVAVGGTNGFFPDGWTNANGAKPWSNESPVAPKEFYLAKDAWYPTWNPFQNNGEDAAMKINYVKVTKLAPDS